MGNVLARNREDVMVGERTWDWLDRPWLPLAVVLLAGVLLLGRLDTPLLEPQEARYAEIPRQMLAEDSWLVPVLHGEPYLDKPPLFYWCVLVGYRLLGVADWVARLVPGLAGVGVVLLVAWWGRLAGGHRLGWLAALILCLCPRFLYQQRQLTMDCLLCLWTTLALAAAYRARQGGRLHRGWWAVAALACGFGLLTKGPVAFVLVLPTLLLMPALERDAGRVGFWDWCWFGLLAVAVAAPWFVAVSLREPEFPAYFFWRHNVERFAAPFDHAKPSWYYLPGLLLGLLPWALLLPALVRQLREKEKPPGVLYALVAAIWPVLFFSLSGCKRPLYLLPALPPLAVVFGRTLLEIAPQVLWRPVLLGVGLLAAAGGVLATAVVGMVSPGTAVLLCVGLGSLALAGWRVDWPRMFAILGTAFGGVLLVLLPAYGEMFGVSTPLRQLGRGAGPVFCHPQRFDSASFYLPGRPVRVFGLEERAALLTEASRQPGAVLLVREGRTLDDLLRDWPVGVPLERSGQRAAIAVLRVGFRAASRGPGSPASPG
jgi:4-amino-4-deoxy-L-arabinose transferase-like glycosyltransferase